MAFRRKANLLLAHKPDIVIIPECEHPDKLKFESGIPEPSDIFWFGSNQNKGLGVFSYSNYKFKLVDSHKPDYRTILPLIVANKKIEFTLFAIWANNPQDRGYQYIGQVWKAINFYADVLKNKKTILAGDFNSNTIRDRKRRAGNHSNVVKFLTKKNIHSTYHSFHKQEQGKERDATLYMYRHKDKPYHIDYCFVSGDMIERLKSVEIGDFDYWTRFSDHVPVMVDFHSHISK